LVLIAAGMAVFGYVELGDIDRQIAKFVSVSGNTGRNLEVEHQAERLRRLAQRYEFTQDDSVIKEFDADNAKAIELLTAAAKATISDERRHLYNDSAASLVASKQLFDKLVAAGKKFVAARGKRRRR
jgi:hypothetical protein